MLDQKNPAISIIEFNVNEWIKQPSQETEIVRVDKKNKLQVQAVPGGSDGSLPAMHETQVRSLGRESTGLPSKRCPGMGSYEERTRESGSFGMWHHTRGYLSNFLLACQASLSVTNSWRLLKLMSVMPSSHFILSSPSPTFNLSQHQGIFQ